jgi:ferredoxin
MTVRVTIDKEKCRGAGQCVMAAPGVFDHDDEGVAFAVKERPDEAEYDDVRMAVVSCPTGSVSVVED